MRLIRKKEKKEKKSMRLIDNVYLIQRFSSLHVVFTQNIEVSTHNNSANVEWFEDKNKK